MEEMQTAVHEAAHAVVGYVQGLTCNGLELLSDPEADAYGVAHSPNPYFGYEQEASDRQGTMREQAIALCAGLAAEHYFCKVPLDTDNENAQSDFNRIIEFERAGLHVPGNEDELVGNANTWDFIAGLLRKALKEVRKYRTQIKQLADALVERRKLTGAEVEQLLHEWLPSV